MFRTAVICSIIAGVGVSSVTANAFTAEGEGAEVVSIGSTAQDCVYDVAVTSDGVIAVGSVGGVAKIDPCCNSVDRPANAGTVFDDLDDGVVTS